MRNHLRSGSALETPLLDSFTLWLFSFIIWKEAHKDSELSSKDIFWLALWKSYVVPPLWLLSAVNPRACTRCCLLLLLAAHCSDGEEEDLAQPQLLQLHKSVARHCCFDQKNYTRCLDETDNADPVHTEDRNDGEFYRWRWSLAPPQAIVQLTSRNRRLQENEFMTCPQSLSPIWNQDPAHIHLAKKYIGWRWGSEK